MKILVVDDSDTILDLIKEILSTHKYEVETSKNGAQALDKYVSFKPDIVTLDLAMPVMDGYETLKRILKIDKNANIIMLTASEQYDMLERCLEKGAIGYIVKPFAAKELITSINNAYKVGSDKNVATMLSLASNKIENSIKKMAYSDSGNHISVTLSKVEVIRQEMSTQILSPSLDVTKIRVVPKAVESFEVQVPRGCIGFITEFGGQQQGSVISYVSQQKDLASLFDINGNDVEDNTIDKILEFFNIFNLKIISELANATHFILDIKPTIIHDPKNQKETFHGSEVTKATFEIVIGQKIITIEVHLQFNTGNIFRGRL